MKLKIHHKSARRNWLSVHYLYAAGFAALMATTMDVPHVYAAQPVKRVEAGKFNKDTSLPLIDVQYRHGPPPSPPGFRPVPGYGPPPGYRRPHWRRYPGGYPPPPPPPGWRRPPVGVWVPGPPIVIPPPPPGYYYPGRGPYYYGR